MLYLQLTILNQFNKPFLHQIIFLAKKLFPESLSNSKYKNVGKDAIFVFNQLGVGITYI